MRSVHSFFALTLFAGVTLSTPPQARAQDDAELLGDEATLDEAADPADESESLVEEPPATELEEPLDESGRVDGPRFRGGVGFTIGGEFFSDFDYSAMMIGIDGRFGVQINDLVGVYFAPHFSAGGKRGAGASGVTATLGGMLMADFTFIDSIAVGAGFGYLIFNNPKGPAIGLRVAGYPLKSFDKDGPKRRALFVSLETRIGFMGSANGTGTMVMGAVGYETF